jgi:hypothetical protein
MSRHTVLIHKQHRLYLRYLHSETTTPIAVIDRFSAYAMAVLADRRSSVAGTRADARPTRVPRGPLDVCRLVRRARQPRRDKRRVY